MKKPRTVAALHLILVRSCTRRQQYYSRSCMLYEGIVARSRARDAISAVIWPRATPPPPLLLMLPKRLRTYRDLTDGCGERTALLPQTPEINIDRAQLRVSSSAARLSLETLIIHTAWGILGPPRSIDFFRRIDARCKMRGTAVGVRV